MYSLKSGGLAACRGFRFAITCSWWPASRLHDARISYKQHGVNKILEFVNILKVWLALEERCVETPMRVNLQAFDAAIELMVLFEDVTAG